MDYFRKICQKWVIVKKYCQKKIKNDLKQKFSVKILCTRPYNFLIFPQKFLIPPPFLSGKGRISTHAANHNPAARAGVLMSRKKDFYPDFNPDD